MLNLLNEQKKEFIKLYEEGDIFGLLYLRDLIGEKDKKLHMDIKELLCYNYVVVDMECGFIDWSQSLIARYIRLKEKLLFMLGIDLGQ